MTINERFKEYFYDNFFFSQDEEFQKFLTSLEKGIQRTIRIKPEKIEEVRSRLEKYGFLLRETYISNVFFLDRKDDFDPLERRIGYTLDHLVGNFYIQELAAATSVHILSDGEIHEDNFLILDMAASPGGKTTQLSEQYPQSFIIANEPTRERIPQLIQNLDRMGSANIGVTLYPGQYFSHTPEIFDRILLDAPCSGEGTLFKGTLATKHWHIKNIRTIARLQEKLLHAALISLKVGGEMVYSTCSMNLIENEGVIKSAKEAFGDDIEIISEKRFWPHKDGTGGFFVSKIRKIGSFIYKERQPKANTNTNIVPSKKVDITLKKGYRAYEHEGKILAVKSHERLSEILETYYFMRFGEYIGKREGSHIDLSLFSHRYIENIPSISYEIPDEETLDRYLRGETLSIDMIENDEISLAYGGIPIGKESLSGGRLSNHFPREWQRK